MLLAQILLKSYFCHSGNSSGTCWDLIQVLYTFDPPYIKVCLLIAWLNVVNFPPLLFSQIQGSQGPIDWSSARFAIFLIHQIEIRRTQI